MLPPIAILRQADTDCTELVELIKRTIGSIRLREPGENRQTETLLVPIHRIHPPEEPMNSVSRIAACYEHTVPATVRYGSCVTNGQIVVGCGWLIVGNVKNLFGTDRNSICLGYPIGYIPTRDTTAIIQRDHHRALLDSIHASTLVGLRDRRWLEGGSPLEHLVHVHPRSPWPPEPRSCVFPTSATIRYFSATNFHLQTRRSASDSRAEPWRNRYA
jgi:hypothetical protein